MKECARHRDPPNYVVYEEGPAATRERWATRGEGFVEAVVGPYLRRARAPECARAALSRHSFGAETPVILAHMMQPFAGRQHVVIVTHLPGLPAATAQEREWTWRGRFQAEGFYAMQRGGSRVFVDVGFDSILNNDLTPTNLASQLLPPGSGPNLRWHRLNLLPEFGPEHVLQIFAGQPDPVDPSHFWFDYTVDGERGTVDVWLTDLARSTRFVVKVQDGPAFERMHRLRTHGQSARANKDKG